MSQLLSHFVKVPSFASPDQVLREARDKERELQNARAPTDVSSFLAPVGVWELKHLRKLSSLTSLTYYMHLVTPRRLQLMHGLDLVVTSRACDVRPYEHNRTAEECGADGDGMAVSFAEARQVYSDLKRGTGAGGSSSGAGAGAGAAPPVALAAGVSNIVSLPRELPYMPLPGGVAESSGGGSGAEAAAAAGAAAAAAAAPGEAAPGQAGAAASGAGGTGGLPLPLATSTEAIGRMLRSPAEVVSAKLAEAALAASAAAAASPLGAAAESFYAGLASLPIPLAGGLVGANNKSANALLAPPSGSGTSSGGTSSSSAGSAAATEAAGGSRSPHGVDAAADPGAPNTSGKATAAAIAAMATAELRSRRLGGNGNGPAKSAGSGSGGAMQAAAGGGMAPVTASGMRLPSAATASASSSAPPSATASALASVDVGTALVPVASSASAASLTFSSSPAYTCPSEWFVVDDPASATRIFVIQGSDTLDHWKLNLTFDPVVFEEPALGVKVHRGVYEAALVLYERFLPLVYEHLEASPFSKVTFTGHSIGGSMATLLMLMYRNRGVLPPHSIATVYTFGAPAVFCQMQQQAAPEASGACCGGSSVSGNGSSAAGSGSSSPRSGSPGSAMGSALQAGGGGGMSLWSLGLSGFGMGGASLAGGSASAAGDSMASVDGTGAMVGGGGGGGGGFNTPGLGFMSVEDPQAVSMPPGAAQAPSPASAPAPTAGPSHNHGHGHGGARGGAPKSCACGVDGLLTRLGLPPHIVRNVVMARDIVPRAFACDYSLVADILKGWGPAFREHCCLNRHGRKHLYYFVGRMCILQPDAWHSFVGGDPEHPMLPPGPELYALAEPEDACAARAHYPALSDLPVIHAVTSSGHSRRGGAGNGASAGAAGNGASAGAAGNGASTGVQQAAAAPAAAAPSSTANFGTALVASAAQRERDARGGGSRPQPRSVVEAVWELMDNPHPLETLADPGAYLTSGTISRYHNPEHYTKALGRLTHLKRLAERRQHPHGQAQAKQAQPHAGGEGIRSMFAGRNIRSFGGGVRSGGGARRGLLHQQAAPNGTAADAVLANGAAGAAGSAWGSAPQLADLVSGNGGRASAGFEGAGGVWDSSDGLDLHLSDFMGASVVGAADPHACR